MPSPCELYEPVVHALRVALSDGGASPAAEVLSLHMLLALIAERSVFVRGGRMAEMLDRAQHASTAKDDLWRDYRNHVLALHGEVVSVPSAEMRCGWAVLVSVFSSFDALYDPCFAGFSYATEKRFVSAAGFQSALCELAKACASDCFVKQDQWPSAIGEVYAGLVLGAARGKSGSWYTPKLIAAKMAKECIDSYRRKNPGTLSILSISCVDPSFGTGSLLLSAMEYCARLAPSINMSTLVARCAYGADCDRGAVDVGRFCLSVRALPTPEHLAKASQTYLSDLCQDLCLIQRHLVAADTLLSTRMNHPGTASLKDKLAVQKFRSAGLPVLCWDDVWPEQFVTSHGTRKPGFACFLSNPPYLKKTALTASYRKVMSDASGTVDFTNVSISEVLSNRFACWGQRGQPNVFTMFVEASIHLLRTHGAGIIISPGSLLVHDSIKYFRQRFFGPLPQQGPKNKDAEQRLLQVTYVGDLRENAKAFRGCECYPTILGFLCDDSSFLPSSTSSSTSPTSFSSSSSSSALAGVGASTITVETLRIMQKTRKRKAAVSKKRDTTYAKEKDQLIVVGGRRQLAPRVLKAYPFWRSSYSLAPLLACKRQSLVACRSNADFLPLNRLLEVRDRPRKSAMLSRMYQLNSFHNGNLESGAGSTSGAANVPQPVAALSTSDCSENSAYICKYCDMRSDSFDYATAEHDGHKATCCRFMSARPRTVSVVISSSVGRHVSLWGLKAIKVNHYVEVPVQGSATKTKTQRVPLEHRMCSRPFFQIDEEDWIKALSNADRDLLSKKKLIFATMCSAPRCFYTSSLTLPYCLPTARFDEKLYLQLCGDSGIHKNGMDEVESRELFMMYISSCLNSDIITSWILEVHGSDSMNNNCESTRTP